MQGSGRRRALQRMGLSLSIAVVLLSVAVPAAGQRPVAGAPVLGLWRVALSVGLTAFGGIVLLGFVPAFGYGVIDSIAENPFVTGMYGLVGTIGLLALLVVTWFLAAVPLFGVIVAFVIVVPVSSILLLGAAAGYIVVGRFLGGLVGVSNAWVGLVIGVGLALVVQLVGPVVAVPVSLPLTMLGVGGGMAQWFGSGGAREERSVPPATRV
ncbi:hypothetical protein [Halococcoides cellulosivorans]|uniref:Uncharacterized protein n=1 Tax=Halococcoides cellulosivorans TaxID=1679096 RepID=A0A2R4X037_9EURY|nr:hypothetical protein [Halococcoides cellulosivorans]AWB27176.1 hypothetical protein HARCEL1_05385 [Halococcoides cellulosivorans]